ncbi:hypothetical protein [Deinococcus pimensis]|uniref:hypothetical protein n=1 Tax=Deinococcus pimensis TaxID=309888 RepID=UPI00047F0285|nr:hypothetical protein [Deinococcus pimensis]
MPELHLADRVIPLGRGTVTLQRALPRPDLALSKQRELLQADLLVVTYPNDGTLQVGWSPPHDPEGEFVLTMRFTYGDTPLVQEARTGSLHNLVFLVEEAAAQLDVQADGASWRLLPGVPRYERLGTALWFTRVIHERTRLYLPVTAVEENLDSARVVALVDAGEYGEGLGWDAQDRERLPEFASPALVGEVFVTDTGETSFVTVEDAQSWVWDALQRGMDEAALVARFDHARRHGAPLDPPAAEAELPLERLSFLWDGREPGWEVREVGREILYHRPSRSPLAWWASEEAYVALVRIARTHGVPRVT